MTTPTINQKTIETEYKYAVKQIRQANKGFGKPVIEPYELRWINGYNCFSLVINYTDGQGKRDFYNIAL